MNLFENEVINISKIYMVNKYNTENELGNKNVRHYNVNLSTYEIVFFISGEGIAHFSGSNIHDTSDSLRYMPKGITDGEYYVKKSTDGVCIDIYFDTQDFMPDFAIGLKNLGELKPLFIKIYNVWNSKKPGFYAKSMSIFYEIIEKIKKHSEQYYTNAQVKKLLPAYNYMLEHFSDYNFDYKTLCSKSELSYDYFKKLFIKQYKVSPVKYVTALRIEKAKELLITGRYSISEIAEMCGFDNIYYFSNVFKKTTGVSPKNYSISNTI